MVRRQGAFGPVELRDSLCSRELLINGQVQGGAYLDPAADSIWPELSDAAPGPISTAAYANGWLLAGLDHPVSSGLMIGLGSGCGAIQLLANFPGVDLTIVEIDPVVVQTALEGFPLLGYYMDRGMLDIRIADASDFLAEGHDRWDFGLADAYTGEAELVADHLPDLIRRASDLYLNVIDRFDGPSMRAIGKCLQAAGKPACEVFKSVPPGLLHCLRDYGCRSNWILTTRPVQWGKAARFQPFADLPDSEQVSLAQQSWDQFLAGAAQGCSEGVLASS